MRWSLPAMLEAGTPTCLASTLEFEEIAGCDDRIGGADCWGKSLAVAPVVFDAQPRARIAARIATTSAGFATHPVRPAGSPAESASPNAHVNLPSVFMVCSTFLCA